MRILRIVSGDDIGGVFTSELLFAREMRRQGDEVLGVVLGQGPATCAYREHFDKVVVIGGVPGFLGNRISKKPVDLLRFAIYPVKQMWRHREEIMSLPELDCIVVRQQPLLVFAALVARLKSSTLCWHTPGALKGRFQKAYFRVAKALARILIIPNSKFTARALSANEKLVVYPGYDPQRLGEFTGGELKRELGVGNDSALVLVMASIQKKKGPDLVLRAFLDSRMFREGGAHIAFAGEVLDSDLEGTLREMASERGESRVHFLGYVAYVGRLLAGADILVNGRRDAEPFGISVVEAQAAGTLVVAYDLGGPGETVVDGATGWLTDSPTVDAYRGALDRAWAVADKWRPMKEKAIRNAQGYSVEMQVEKMRHIIGNARGYVEVENRK